ncbi:MAG: TIGR00730 family Rossman fold protein [Bacteroidales bacterium]|nr:TIGR00730 family Rossman fold protein [Bacteroidales bacterium]
MKEKQAVIFCSANKDIDEIFGQTAREVVRAVCSAGYGITSGGTIKGTMGVISDTCRDIGAYHRGVLPRFMADFAYPHLDEIVWTEKMSERKDCMREGTCLAIALPGGIGTFDELIETMTLKKLDKYPGRIVVINVNGYFEPLRELLDNMVKTNMLYPKDRALIDFISTVEELKSII